MPLILGLLFAILGFILLVVGGFGFAGRQKISNLSARLAGVFFLAFFPLVFGARFVEGYFAFGLDADQMAIVYWSLIVLCIGGGALVLLRALWKAPLIRQAKTRVPSGTVPSVSSKPKPGVKNEDAGGFSPAPAKPNPPKKQRGAESENPFDFS